MSKVGPTYKDNGLDAMPLTDSGIIKLTDQTAFAHWLEVLSL